MNRMIGNILVMVALICVSKFANSIITLKNSGEVIVQNFHTSAEGMVFSKLGSLLSTQVTSNTKECCFKCVQNKKCLSVNTIALDKSRYQCELLNWAGSGFKNHLVLKVNSKFMQLQCSPNPCQNGGICTVNDGGTKYTCTCSTGHTGRHCEINMCSPNPCQNGGICTVKDGGTNYSCTCLVDITGRNCELQHLSGWSSWTAWKPCDCGKVNRTRTCQIDPCVGPSFDQKDCIYPTIMTEKGKCAFPFIYKGVCYDACTDVGHSTEWCSLNKIYRSYQWGNCP